MARLARVVAPGLPHHVTQRGNRRQQTFFCDEDYQCYVDLMAQFCKAEQVEIWAYCLMPNHVHLIAVPQSGDGLGRAIGEAHRRYTRMVNFREGWRGHLWQGRFSSFVLDERYLLTAARYVELNPVRAGLVNSPRQYRWSSARPTSAGRMTRWCGFVPCFNYGDACAVCLSLPVIANEPQVQRPRLSRRHPIPTPKGRPLAAGASSTRCGVSRGRATLRSMSV